ncbi:MAG TPA: ATP-binding protein [Blastocatellia bacterium]|nr:ATP-binding protein [Blastocatellia bacterium]
MDEPTTKDLKISVPPGGRKGTRPDMFANLQAAYAELTETQVELERRAAEINEMRDLFERVIESMSEALFLLDSSGRIVRVNRAAGRLLGMDPEELTGKPFADVCGTTDVPTTPKELLDRAPGGTLTHYETTIRSLTGQAIPVNLSCVLSRDRRGKITGVLINARDISEIYQAQQAERELMRLKEEFVASISHELRTPLASIKGFAELLRKGKADDPALQQEFLTRMIHEVDRLMALVNDLLDMSRMESGRLELTLVEVDLADVITETFKTLGTLAEQKGITLRSTLPDQPLVVRADRLRLEQVLINLVGNAIKFTDGPKPVLVTAESETDRVVVKVIDQGPGIPEEEIPRLFDKFYQVTSSAKRAAKGTGLGLYISRLIVEAHGGHIGVITELGKGSTFYFTLPRR